jgi:hypothetical protein
MNANGKSGAHSHAKSFAQDSPVLQCDDWIDGRAGDCSLALWRGALRVFFLVLRFIEFRP